MTRETNFVSIARIKAPTGSTAITPLRPEKKRDEKLVAAFDQRKSEELRSEKVDAKGDSAIRTPALAHGESDASST